jgi:alkanesulfonate monooxygenase SsuD/methylene tetrahydromethanopterin reductase-like flavin-dependent oxidoreductase (luciferase family)
MIDVMSGGRLVAGLIRGVPHEYIAYNVVPGESRERLREATALIIKCWTEPEPFGWEGEYYQFPSVSIWPKPMQRPYPQILMSASNEESAEFAGQHRAMIGMTLIADLKIAQRCIDVYRQSARAHGKEPVPDDILIGQNTCIAETDEEAKEHLAAGLNYFHKVLMHSIRDAMRLVVQ